MNYDSFPSITLPHHHLADFTVGPPWLDVITETDLPPRLLIGDLVQGSYARNPSGWSVEYRHDPFSLRIRRNGEKLEIEEFFNGTSVAFSFQPANGNQSQILQQTALASGAWDERLSDFYTSRYNIGYVAAKDAGKDVPWIQGFPDGFFHGLILPIPFQAEAFQQVVSVLAEMEAQGVPFSGTIQVETYAINYRKDRCPDTPQGPELLAAAILRRGFLPVGLPVWQGKEPDTALTARQAAYILRGSFPMRFGPQILDAFFRHGLIAAAGARHPEDAGLLSLQQIIQLAQELRFFTNDRSRRICYARRSNDATLQPSDQTGKQTTLRDVERSFAVALQAYRRVRSAIA